MEKVNYNMQDVRESIFYQRGVEQFRLHHKLEPKYPEARKLIIDEHDFLDPDKPVKFNWFKRTLDKSEYASNKGLCVLGTEGNGLSKRYTVAYMSPNDESDIIITDKDDLQRIKDHMFKQNVKM